MPVDKL